MNLKENSTGNKSDSKTSRKVDMEGNEKSVLSSFY